MDKDRKRRNAKSHIIFYSLWEISFKVLQNNANRVLLFWYKRKCILNFEKNSKVEMVYSDSSVNIFYIMKHFVRFFTFMLYFKFPERKLKGFRNRSGNDADSSFIYHANFSWFLPVRLLSVVLCCGRTCNEKLQCSRALQRGWVNCGLCVLWLINFFAGQHGFTRLLCEKYLRNTTFTLAV